MTAFITVMAVLVIAAFFIWPRFHQAVAIGTETSMMKVKSIIGGASEFRQHADRIAQIRAGGSGSDGIHLLHDPLKITEDDYLLMGCDNSTAGRNFPNIPRDQRSEFRWFAGAADFPKEKAGGNYHATTHKDGRVEIEAFYTDLPYQQYQASPEEVAWHYIRVKELRAKQIPQAERVTMMNAEATRKPWEAMK